MTRLVWLAFAIGAKIAAPNTAGKSAFELESASFTTLTRYWRYEVSTASVATGSPPHDVRASMVPGRTDLVTATEAGSRFALITGENVSPPQCACTTFVAKWKHEHSS